MKNALPLLLLCALALAGCPAPVPLLQVSPASLDFNTRFNQRTMTVTNAGAAGSTLDATVTTSAEWLSVSGSSVSLGAGLSEQVTVSLDRDALPAGDSTATLEFESNGGSATVQVSASADEETEGEGEPQLEGEGAAEGEGETPGALPDLGVNANLNGWSPFGDGDEWNRRVDGDAVAANSNSLIDYYGPDDRLKIDAGTTEEYYGIPYVVVPGTQPLVTIAYGTDGYDYSDESDLGPMPIPLDAPIEGGSSEDPNPDSGDRHILVIDRDNMLLYELYNSIRIPNGFRCSSSAVWNLNATNNTRPAGWTSADAGGMPIFPGLLKYEEAAAGEITHALRMTVNSVRAAYTYPGNHFGPSTNSNRMIYGQRLRLKAGFSEAGYTGAALNIVRALKRYGVIIADQGTDFYITGVTDPGWEDIMPQIRNIRGSDLEVLAPTHPVVED